MEDKLSNSWVQHLAVNKLFFFFKKNVIGKYVSALFLNLSKATYTINHDLLQAKLMVFGFSHNALKWMYSFKQKKTKNSNQ